MVGLVGGLANNVTRKGKRRDLHFVLNLSKNLKKAINPQKVIVKRYKTNSNAVKRDMENNDQSE